MVMESIKIWAHRGASAYAPENTMEAFKLAVEMGADGIELDVHLSKDGELIVAHDEKVDRICEGSGRIMDMTAAQLKSLRVSKPMLGFEDARIPTLREVMALLSPTRMWLNIELKTNVYAYEGIEQKCIDLAREYGMEKRVLFSSFNHHSLLRVKAIDPSFLCGILYDNIMVRPWDYAKALGFDALHPHFSELKVPGEIEDSHQAGIMINAWTLNSEEELKNVAATALDGIITDYPDRALRLLGR